jgi:hypothetical protein
MVHQPRFYFAQRQAAHTINFDWFMSGLEWILKPRVLLTKTFDVLSEMIMKYQIYA